MEEHKMKIRNLKQLFDCIEYGNCYIFDKAEDFFVVEAPNNATQYIGFEKDDDIEKIVYNTIEQLEAFDADDEFTRLWCADFAKHNAFTPLQFITMLKKDENTFGYLARELKKIEQ